MNIYFKFLLIVFCIMSFLAGWIDFLRTGVLLNYSNSLSNTFTVSYFLGAIIFSIIITVYRLNEGKIK